MTSRILSETDGLPLRTFSRYHLEDDGRKGRLPVVLDQRVALLAEVGVGEEPAGLRLAA